MTHTFKIGDRVKWEDTKYGRRKITVTQHEGTILYINEASALALIDKGKWQRRVEVYLYRLRPYADTTMEVKL